MLKQKSRQSHNHKSKPSIYSKNTLRYRILHNSYISRLESLEKIKEKKKKKNAHFKNVCVGKFGHRVTFYILFCIEISTAVKKTKTKKGDVLAGRTIECAMCTCMHAPLTISRFCKVILKTKNQFILSFLRKLRIIQHCAYKKYKRRHIAYFLQSFRG